jgi:hypothetical protein
MYVGSKVMRSDEKNSNIIICICLFLLHLLDNVILFGVYLKIKLVRSLCTDTWFLKTNHCLLYQLEAAPPI